MPVALTTFALCYAGYGSLSLAMNRHHAQVWARNPPPRVGLGLRAGGWLLLTMAAWAAVSAWGSGVGMVSWLGFSTAAAMLFIWLLSYRPRLAAGLVAGAGAVGLLAVLTGA